MSSMKPSRSLQSLEAELKFVHDVSCPLLTMLGTKLMDDRK
jgi:hypothetical protein